IKINVLTRETRDGRACWIKRRRAASGPIMAIANRFFTLAGNPVCALADPRVWQRWEIACFLQLHGDLFRAFACGKWAVGADELPGESLSRHLNAGTLSPEMLAAAGRELRRAHDCHCAEFGGPWSHGDPHSGNFIYDDASGRARLIDFEVMHYRSLPADERHADDLLVFLQDLVGRISSDGWLPGARAFLEAYGRPEIVRLLDQRLVVPRGLARLWWSVRTTYLPQKELAQRITALRAMLPSTAVG
ncbi:MAG TPA: hypothetical protein VFD27_00590, partial [Chthoniobacteraceae bacterium]|nr:hypothetical protein [Chthoniobacteraceae bacterium]